MYLVHYSTNKLELTGQGWNVWRVEPTKRQFSYKIIDIIIGSKRVADAKVISVGQGSIIVNTKGEAIERIFEVGGAHYK